MAAASADISAKIVVPNPARRLLSGCLVMGAILRRTGRHLKGGPARVRAVRTHRPPNLWSCSSALWAVRAAGSPSRAYGDPASHACGRQEEHHDRVRGGHRPCRGAGRRVPLTAVVAVGTVVWAFARQRRQDAAALRGGRARGGDRDPGQGTPRRRAGGRPAAVLAATAHVPDGRDATGGSGRLTGPTGTGRAVRTRRRPRRAGASSSCSSPSPRRRPAPAGAAGRPAAVAADERPPARAAARGRGQRTCGEGTWTEPGDHARAHAGSGVRGSRPRHQGTATGGRGRRGAGLRGVRLLGHRRADPVGGHARGPESEESLSWGTGGPEPANGHAREPEFAEPLAEGPGGGGRLSRGPAAVNPAEPGRNTEIR